MSLGQLLLAYHFGLLIVNLDFKVQLGTKPVYELSVNGLKYNI